MIGSRLKCWILGRVPLWLSRARSSQSPAKPPLPSPFWCCCFVFSSPLTRGASSSLERHWAALDPLSRPAGRENRAGPRLRLARSRPDGPRSRGRANVELRAASPQALPSASSPSPEQGGDPRGPLTRHSPPGLRQGSGSPMAPLLLTLAAAAAAALAWPCPAAPSESRFSEARVARWAAAALKHVAATQCPDRGGLLPRPHCQRLVRLSPGPGPAVYISEPARPGQKVRALLPDGWGDKPSAPLVPSRNRSGGGGPQRAALAPAGQDAVLVLDPSPGANFGHPLLLFYVDFNVSPRRCRSRERLYLGSYECLTPVQRNHCENQLKRRPGRGKGRSQRSAGHMRHEEPPVGFCEIHFLPLIVLAQDLKHLQKLHCIDLHGYSPCPQPLPLVSSSSTAAYCELNKNTRRCHRQQAPMYKLCRMYQTCDHAVLIAGGWQEQVTYPHHAQNLLLFYQMLRQNGFRQEHIKAFFANEGQASVEMGNVQPATEKLAIRSHLALICRSLHCADTLVLYLNSPASSDGTMFLWDANHNGIADPKERYAISELLTDLESCNARRVLLFLDQSYPGPLVKKLQASQRHPNVVLVHSTTALRSGSAFAEFWAGLQPDQCLLQHTLPVGSWSAVFASGTPIQLLNVTLAGAPCHSVPPLGEEERQRRYHGCQNLPTMLWYQSRHQQELQQDD